jgi:hypothetical protein
MLDDLYQSDNEQALDNLATLPPEKPKPVTKWNGWSAPLRGMAAGAAESVGFVADSVKGYSQVMGATGTQSAGGMFSLQSDAEKRDAELQRFKIEHEGLDTTSNVGTSFRNVSRDYRPDPATASLAESLAFDLTRFATKAVGYTVAGGGAPGAVMLGADEGMQTADDLAQQGVDQATRMKVGAVAGGTAAAGVLLPVAAPGSITKTVGLWAVGGPGAFIAQQSASSKVLEDANYTELSKAYDPLDPVGLAVASLVPAAFAVHAVAGARVGKPGAKPEPAGLTPEQSDAVMTHNLTLAQDVREATSPPEAVRIVRAVEVKPENVLSPASYERANKAIADNPIAAREKLLTPEQSAKAASDLAPVLRAAEEAKPKFDATLTAIADQLNAGVKLAEVKGGDRLLEKHVLENGGDTTGMRDLVRGSLVVENIAEVKTALDALKRDFEVTRIKDRFTNPTESGYRDMLVNVRLPNGSEAEVQIHIPEMIAAKKLGHKVYDIERRLAADHPDKAALQQLQSDIYAEALAGNASRTSNLLDPVRSQSSNSGLDSASPSARTLDALGNGREAPSLPNAKQVPSGSRDTGTPSTSKNLDSGGSAESSMVASDAPIVPGAGETRKLAPHVKSVLSRAAEVERMNPNMVVGVDEAGNPITVKQEMDRIRRESMEGTDTELGAQDAGLLEVAADCALSTGAM